MNTRAGYDFSFPSCGRGIFCIEQPVNVPLIAHKDISGLCFVKKKDFFSHLYILQTLFIYQKYMRVSVNLLTEINNKKQKNVNINICLVFLNSSSFRTQVVPTPVDYENAERNSMT